MIDTKQLSKNLLNKNKYSAVISLLFNARTNVHIAHLQTKSFAAHKATDDFYKEVVELGDRFAESAQGTQGILTGYSLGNLNTGDIVSFLQSQMSELVSYRSQFTEGHLVQILDDCIELYSSTIYKLVNLK